MVKKRSSFDLSHNRAFSMNMGNLTPILCEEMVPGDEFKMNTNFQMRFAPLVSPVMSNIDVYVKYFFVPNRILWNNPNDSTDNWEDFITGGKNNDNNAVKPYITFSTPPSAGSLADYLGIPTEINSTLQVDALPFRAYNKIYNDYFRDENLQDEVSIGTNGGEDTTTDLTIKNKCWQKDYFTTALLSPQRGDSVSIPLTGDAPVITTENITNELGAPLRWNTSGSKNNVLGVYAKVPDGYPATGISGDSFIGALYGENIHPVNLTADLSDVSAVNINQLREASALQRFAEKSMRNGYRYVEQILSIFGVRAGDDRLQRAEYIGGNKVPVVFSEVLQTSSSTDTSAQGNMAGTGISFCRGKKVKYYAREHGYLIGLMCVIPQTLYYQGVRKEYLRQSRYDYLLPDFSNLGEQEVLQAEIYANSSEPNKTFGYQQRYAEYRTIPNSVHGEFRTNLDYWHTGRKFTTDPSLNESFVKSDPTTRIFAVEDSNVSQQLYVFLANNILAKRPLPKYSKPSLR